MRKTVYKLCERLKEDETISSELNPMPFVGHGRGSDGMEWLGEQEEILKKFRSGKCKLLISTSVLEEGLDVPVCNLVIRFDSSMSLRSLVQGRGRASRRRDGRFVVICCDLKEKEAALKAISEEQYMEQAMRIEQNKTKYRIRQAARFGCEVKSIETKTATEQDIRQAQDYEKEEPVGCKTEKKKILTSKIEIRICKISSQEGSKDAPEVIDFLQGNFEVVSSLPEITKTTVNEEEVYKKLNPGRSIRYEIEPSEECNQQFGSKAKFFRHVAEAWCSRERILLGLVRPSQMWLIYADLPRDRIRKPMHILPAECFSIGYFLNRVHFASHRKPAVHNIQLVFEHDFKRFVIYFATIREKHKIEIHYNEMDQHVLVDKRLDSRRCSVFLSLRHAPRLYRAMQQVEIDDNEEMDNFEDWYESFNEDLDYEEMEGYFDFEADYDSALEDYPEQIEGIHEEVREEEEEEEEEDVQPPLFGEDVVTEWERVTEITDNSEVRINSVFGECFTFKFVLHGANYADLNHLLTTLVRFDKKIYYAQMETSERPLPVFNIPPYLPFDVIYATECLLSAHPSSRGRIGNISSFKRLLHSENEKIQFVIVALEELSSILRREQFCDPLPVFEALLKLKHLRSGSISSKLLPSQCALIKRLVITPMSLLFFPAEVMCKNRVLRNYDTEHFICINIRDEDFSKISAYSGKIPQLLERFRTVLKGGVWLGNYLFRYLGCSNSQLRNHSCWFVRAPPPPENIRAWMGDFTGIRLVVMLFHKLRRTDVDVELKIELIERWRQYACGMYTWLVYSACVIVANLKQLN